MSGWIAERLAGGALQPDDLEVLARVAQRALGVTVDGRPGKHTLLAATLDELQHGPPTGHDLARLCRLQVGDRYVFGHEVELSARDPDTWDCSELVQWATSQLGVPLGDGSWLQLERCQRAGLVVPVEHALATVGALLFEFRDKVGQLADPGASRPARAHIEVSLGDGRTVGARSPRHGVDVFPRSERWTHAALVPGLQYG